MIPVLEAEKPRKIVVGVTTAAVFLFTWLFRFNDPNGSFAGLTDDHFFYVVRGWQILHGDLPVRDFVDHGAPLYYYVAAGVQVLFGRGTLSELTFSVTMIAAGAALTFWLATRASGSITLGLCGAFVQIWLLPRFYNYPKILVYATAIPLLWQFVDRPRPRPRFWLALTTALAFLFRHDHGAFVAATVAVALLLSGISWGERVRHAVVYGALTIALLAPYLVFIQLNGGLVSYFQQALSWNARERERTEIVWPGLFDYPDGISPNAQSASTLAQPVWAVRDNASAWWYYFELALPFLAFGVMAMSPTAFRPDWERAGPKVAVVAMLSVILNAGFLRSPLNARLADPSVPHAILIAWLAAALTAMWRPELWRQGLQPWRVPLRSAALVAAAPLAFVLAATLSNGLYGRLDSAGLTEGVGRMFTRAASTAQRVRADWELETWIHRRDRPDLLTLAMYLNACTRPTARVFVQPYIPQVVALARRPFAGGHADLRGGFFATDQAQALTVARLQRQHVPVALLDGPLEEFQASFPAIGAYLSDRYEVAGRHVFDQRFDITLLLRKDLDPSGRFTELDWPCL